MIAKTVFAFALLYLSCFQIVTGVSEREVASMLLADYQKEGRPVRDPTQVVLTSLDVYVIQIVKLIPRRQVLVINFWLVQRWRDDFLTWDPAEYGNISTIRLGSENIWRPRLVNYNRQHEEGWSELPDTNAIVRSDGEVLWTYPITLRSTCVLDIARFPFDVQKCPLKFGSWTYDSLNLKLVNISTTGNIDYFAANGEWELLSFDLEVNEVEYSCCPGIPWDDMTYTITLQRRPKFFILYLVAPSVTFSLLTVWGFWLPPDSGERLSLCINLLLALIFLQQGVAAYLPDTATNIPLIDVFFVANILLVGASSILTILTLSIHFKCFDLPPVPNWLRCLFCLDQSDSSTYRVNAPQDNNDGAMDAFFATNGSNPAWRLVRRVKKIIRQLKEEQEMMTNCLKTESEWKILLGKIDRCLLIAFFIALVVITASILGPNK
ncbi:neuronal acetylcholine receptor subunit alpha-9-like isoform X1 [Branchiostoma floridae]|uniref:Neuronal acetylcholine receptor subunit alpha-9-like isoform X1 n=1 Tax=Branchiostoma floridae TaxID=7739 RepID=A0A9J7MJN0_BRAFL|nr:neuronal acetylcholine receptor subunit alpha-9-like isoform X1 [Branchiostoma floridae]